MLASHVEAAVTAGSYHFTPILVFASYLRHGCTVCRDWCGLVLTDCLQSAPRV